MFATETADVCCRAIEPRDIPAVVECLARNFSARSRDYWLRGLDALGRRELVSNYPRYGHLLEVEGAVVGVLLQIFSDRGEAGARCNLSSWCVDPDYRTLSYLLQARATRERNVDYVNVTPAPHTAQFLEATGFRRFAAGRMLFAPLLSRGRERVKVVRFSQGSPEVAQLDARRRRLLADHAALGCEALVGVVDGAAKGFVFQLRRFAGGLIAAQQVIYCEDIADLAIFASALGRHFARQGVFLCLVDVEQPVPGLVGRFVRRRTARYFKGKAAPSPCDLAYTEFVLLGR